MFIIIDKYKKAQLKISAMKRFYNNQAFIHKLTFSIIKLIESYMPFKKVKLNPDANQEVIAESSKTGYRV